MTASSRHPLDKGAIGDNLEYKDIIEEMRHPVLSSVNGTAVFSSFSLHGGSA